MVKARYCYVQYPYGALLLLLSIFDSNLHSIFSCWVLKLLSQTKNINFDIYFLIRQGFQGACAQLPWRPAFPRWNAYRFFLAEIRRKNVLKNNPCIPRGVTSRAMLQVLEPGFSPKEVGFIPVLARTSSAPGQRSDLSAITYLVRTDFSKKLSLNGYVLECCISCAFRVLFRDWPAYKNTWSSTFSRQGVLFIA